MGSSSTSRVRSTAEFGQAEGNDDALALTLLGVRQAHGPAFVAHEEQRRQDLAPGQMAQIGRQGRPPISRWRLLTRKVTPRISSRCGGEVQSPIAANSEPPPKFSPVSIGTSIALNPLAVAWAPRTRVKGMKPIITGIEAFRPRDGSAGAGLRAASGRLASSLRHPGCGRERRRI